jgi:sugar lactone lactonase YvrE
MYILDYDTYREKNTIDPPSYRVHLWPKNAKVGRILLTERGEQHFGWYSYIVLDKYMNIYVGTRYCIRKWLASTNYTEVVTVAGTKDIGGNSSNQLRDPRGLYIDNNLTMYIADWNNRRIQKWIMNGDQGITLLTDLSDVNGMTQDCTGNLYYTDAVGNIIYQLNLETNQTRIVINNSENIHNGRYEGLWMPFGMRFDKFGNMFVIDFQHSRIRKYSIL